MTRLVVCCDGTWQTTAQQSNVIRFHDALDLRTVDGERQRPKYVTGVGTSGGVLAKLKGGLAGAGLSSTIIEAYDWIAARYAPGDTVALFGFSRGAYTARSVAGMIGACGLLDASSLSAEDRAAQVARVYARYRNRRRMPGDTAWREGLRLHYDPAVPGSSIPVVFVGVWDTVGALGIPDNLRLLPLLGRRSGYEFLDVRLNPGILHARHAVSLDERRGPFVPTLWSDVPATQDVAQLWFPGDHADVGGGHRERGLSDGALRWMMDEATAAIGLAFRPERIPEPDPGDVAHPRPRGRIGALTGPVVDAVALPWPRAVPRVDETSVAAGVLHRSAVERQRIPGLSYRPTHVPAPGDTTTVQVRADTGWTETGWYLEPGEYRFTAEGSWSSGGQETGPEGDTTPPHSALRALERLTARGETLVRGLVGRPAARGTGSRRVEALPWMSLVGLVANETRNALGALTAGHEILPIGAGRTVRTERPGYLFAFANDRWGFTANNSGTVTLTCERVRAS
ncbi:MAG: DUF2235 domain-containing protein [Pseudonocardia sp.]|nr:DUF2235 domain-containing protein [Pseudonocardia sp.]